MEKGIPDKCFKKCWYSYTDIRMDSKPKHRNKKCHQILIKGSIHQEN